MGEKPAKDDADRWLDRKDVLLLWAWADEELTDAEAARLLANDEDRGGGTVAHLFMKKLMDERRELVAAVRGGKRVLAIFGK